MFENLIVFSLAKLSKSASRLTKCFSANYFGMVRVMAVSNLLSIILKLPLSLILKTMQNFSWVFKIIHCLCAQLSL